MKIINKNDKSLNQRGNAMVYVLVALALFGFLTVTLSSQNDQADGQDLNDEIAELYANELIEYASAAQNSIDLMLASGSEVNDLDFVNPSSAAFNTPPHYHKVFHPQGGGLNYQENFSSDIATHSNSQWVFKNNTNVEWSPTAAADVILSALRVQKQICEILNKKITGTTDIPTMGLGLNAYFENNGLNNNLDLVACSECEGFPSLCVVNGAGTAYAFYSIIATQ